MDRNGLIEALETLGELLDSRDQAADVAVIGGGALLLAKHIARPTKDLDAVAIHDGNALVSSDPLPEYLREATEDVARILDLDPRWFNGGPTDLLEFGLPEGFLERAQVQQFGTLTLRVADRLDQVHFKLYAAADQGPESRHVQDLLRLSPTESELETAASWCRTHDPSPGFASVLGSCLENVASLIRKEGQGDHEP